MLEMNTRKTGGRSGDSKKNTSKKGTRGTSAAFSKSSTRSTSKPKSSPKVKDKGKPTPEGAKTVKPKAKGRFIDFKEKVKKGDPLPTFNDDAIRLNKYLSNAGICSRREADMLIKTGIVSVNGEIVTEMGYKVKPEDVIKYDGESINAEKKRYVLLNKPKGNSHVAY